MGQELTRGRRNREQNAQRLLVGSSWKRGIRQADGPQRGSQTVTVTVPDACCGDRVTRALAAGRHLNDELQLKDFHGWYDVVITVAENPAFERQLTGHVESGRDSFSDPAMGGLVDLKA